MRRVRKDYNEFRMVCSMLLIGFMAALTCGLLVYAIWSGKASFSECVNSGGTVEQCMELTK